MPEAPGPLASWFFALALLVPLGLTVLGLLYAILLTFAPGRKGHTSSH